MSSSFDATELVLAVPSRQDLLSMQKWYVTWAMYPPRFITFFIKASNMSYHVLIKRFQNFTHEL